MLGVSNTTTRTVQDITITWDYEKYRSGTRVHSWTFFTSTDGTNWTSRTSGDQTYTSVADTNNNTTIFSPPQTLQKIAKITGVNLAPGAKFYFRWTLTGVGATTSSDTNGQGLGIDNVKVSADTVAQDDACNSPYGTGNFNGQNGGTNFNAWSVSPTANTSTNGAFAGDSNGNGSISGTGPGINRACGNAWALYASGGNLSDATRTFASGGLGDGLSYGAVPNAGL
jgi:hypothetical protein